MHIPPSSVPKLSTVFQKKSKQNNKTTLVGKWEHELCVEINFCNNLTRDYVNKASWEYPKRRGEKNIQGT